MSLNERLVLWLRRLGQTDRTVLDLLIAAVIIGLIGALVFGTSAHGQTLVPLDAKADASACAPGYYGELWPGSKSHLMRRGDAGWYAYAWCKMPDGTARFAFRACAHGECPMMESVGQQIGQLVWQAIGSDRLQFIKDWIAGHPVAFRCSVAPPDKFPPVLADEPAPGTPRGKVCAELRAMMAADWPMVPAPPPPPPPWAPTHAVKANPSATDLSRPVVTLNADGTLGTKTLGRAAAGTDCDTRLPTRASTGTDLYATPIGRAAREVALCARKP